MLKLFVAWVIAGSTFAGAAELDIQPGFRLAQEICAECHQIGLSLLPSPDLAAPAFVVLANELSLTDAALRSLLRASHRDMPNIILDGSQVEDLIAYLRSLQAR